MEKLIKKKELLVKSAQALERSINLYQESPGNSLAEKEAYTASVIKHFELFFELFWKYLKAYLFEQYGIETLGSKDIFRACSIKKIITDQELQDLLIIIDNRNATVHVYDENMARKSADTILQYYVNLKDVIHRLAQ